MPEPLLELEGLSYSYPGGRRTALDDVELELYEGELVLVAGSSASGKSTLLRAVAGLVPHFFGGEFTGRVVVGGLDTRDHGPAEVATVASSLFQDPESQVVMNSVWSELALPLESGGWQGATVSRAIEETALALGIADLLERPIHTLSGGELQRVALGAALVRRPRLLLLDEPTSQLDPVAGDELIWQLRRLNEEWGTTVVLAEQRLERCLAAADRVIALDRGRIAFDGRPREFVAWAVRNAGELAPPVARMCALAGLEPLPVGVKDGRALLRRRGLTPGAAGPQALESAEPRDRGRRHRRRSSTRRPALELSGVWVQYDDGSGAGLAALRGLSLSVGLGETVALLGRNGAGKSTLLRVAAGLRPADRGRARVGGELALVLQNPGDYFLHERVRDELPAGPAQAALAELGLDGLEARDPCDLSGGERQRLALAVVLAGRGLGGGEPPAVAALDEPTRGLDRGQKQTLADRLRGLAERGSAVIVATHDVEFAARVANRCVMLARGRVVADGATRDVLSGGRYFATEVARALGPAARAVLPEQGARWLRELSGSVGDPGQRAAGEAPLSAT
jgi:energy-coupling factor transporter ATP-binding protein EcfA2